MISTRKLAKMFKENTFTEDEIFQYLNQFKRSVYENAIENERALSLQRKRKHKALLDAKINVMWDKIITQIRDTFIKQ